MAMELGEAQMTDYSQMNHTQLARAADELLAIKGHVITCADCRAKAHVEYMQLSEAAVALNEVNKQHIVGVATLDVRPGSRTS